MIVCLGTTPALSRTMEFASVAVDGVNRAQAVREYAAGKAINAARAITTLGGDALTIGPAGGSTGERLKELAISAAAQRRWINVATSTRLCLTVVDRGAGTSTELIEESPAMTAAEGDLLYRALTDALPNTRVCVLSGSLAPQLDPAFYSKCIDACRAAGVETVLDASGAALRAAIVQRPDVVKINVSELAGVNPLTGEGEQSITDAAKTLARQTGGWVIVTRGRLSTLAMRLDGGFAVSVPAVNVVSAIGSGDSFAGALALGLHNDVPIEEALRSATACASANAATADAAHFGLAEVERLKTSIRVEQR